MRTLRDYFRGWMLRRFRLCLWKQWKRIRTRLRELRALGLPEWVCLEFATSRKSYWRMSGGPIDQSDAPSILERSASPAWPIITSPQFDEPPYAERHVRKRRYEDKRLDVVVSRSAFVLASPPYECPTRITGPLTFFTFPGDTVPIAFEPRSGFATAITG